MPVLEIRKYPDPVLREVTRECRDFSPALSQLLSDMLETMYAADGIGLAAPQVGISTRVAVVDVRRPHSEFGAELPDGPIELINPSIIEATGSCTGEEGCLSIPGYGEKVKRSETIVVQAQSRTGEAFQFRASGLLSVCIQHELDHLNGILFIDHLSALKKQLFKRWVKKHVL